MPLGRLLYKKFPFDSVLELFHVRNDADGKMLVFQTVKAVHHDVHQMFVQRAEPLVQEKELDGPQRPRTDLRAQRKRQRQRYQEGLSAESVLTLRRFPPSKLSPTKNPPS